QVRGRLDRSLADARVRLDAARAALDAATAWCAAVTAGRDPLAARLPPDPKLAGQVIDTGDVLVVAGTDRADSVRVARDPATGGLIVTVDGVPRYVRPGTRLIVRTGAGDDRVVVDPDVTAGVTVLAGAGDDRVTGGSGDDLLAGLGGDDVIHGRSGRDRVTAGAGRDYVDGGAGSDAVRGGAGDDTAYGLSGDDRLDGGAGVDYLDGGRGDDRLIGGADGDALTGGRGRDDVRGGAGDDYLYGGDDADILTGGAGGDVAYAQADDVRAGVERDVDVALTAADAVRVRGTADFVERVGSDLDTLRSSPVGGRMLDALRVDGAPVTVTATPDANGYAIARGGVFGAPGVDVEFNPEFQAVAGGPPVTVLFHELAHAYDLLHDTYAPGVYTGPDDGRVNNMEREAVGLPVDHDGDPTTPPRSFPGHPDELTENALRAELGVPPRQRYG
ncbi:M91 family zinc metallopeptidase, partial [Luedemannella flava]|uniref:M91 family zinc metallopeptidase n=1 Tax=Luedemannella flava TaxID=349316 RepID=UPI0031CE3243